MAALAAIVFFLAFYNLKTFPSPTYDEGVHLLVAEKLALEGLYGFGPALGPTVFFPVAAAFRIAGVGLLQARVVMAAYLCLFALAFYALARHLGGWKIATLGTLLLVSSPGANTLRLGRQVLGEVPAMLFFLLGALLWLKTLEETRPYRRSSLLLLAGILLGLAILTKNQFFLLLPAWVMLWVADRVYYRQLGHMDFVLPLASAIACVMAWYVGQRLLFPLGERLAAYNAQEWSRALGQGIVVFSWREIAVAARLLTEQDAFYAWIVPGSIYAGILSAQRSREGLRWALPAMVAAVWLGWFLLLSVSWPRYAFVAFTMAALFIARLFHDLTGGYRLPIGEFLSRIRSGKWDLAFGQRVALMALLLVFVSRLVPGRVVEVITKGEDTPQQMATYIVDHLPQGTRIETYDSEVCFLSGYECHIPPFAVFGAWIDYDFEAYNTSYLLIGDFGRLARVYDPDLVARDYDLETSIGGYELYRVKPGE